MKKITKRIACGALSLMMLSSLALERTVRFNADNTPTASTAQTGANGVAFKNVTGKYDTSQMMQENFNASVMETENVAPKYEVRTVIVTLDGKTMVDKAEGENVTDYLSTFQGNLAQSDIRAEQKAFLKKLSKMGISYKYKGGYDTVLNGVAIEMDTKNVATVKQMAGVDGVYITTRFEEPKTVDVDTSGVPTNQTNVYKTGIYNASEYTDLYGEGSVVAILDTGLDYTHPAYQGFTKEGVKLAWDMEYVESVFNNRNFELSAETRSSGSLSAKDVYVSDKVPFAFDYADDDADVYPSYSNHGTHVAGIIGGYDTNGYTDKDGNPVNETFMGVVPDSQLMICKVFTDDFNDPDLGGAVSEDIVAALDDCVKLGVDVINMSLGSSCGFTTTDDGDAEGEMLNEVYNRIQKAGISLVCAASNDYSSGYNGVYGTNLASNPDAGTVGSPSTYPGALSVASINGQKAGYVVANADNSEKQSFVFFEEARDIDGNPFDFVKGLMDKYNQQEFEYVVVSGKGLASDYTLIRNMFRDNAGNSLKRIALIERGDSTFEEKVRIAMDMGAIGVIIYNNVSGMIRMNLGEIDDPVPAISINMTAGNKMVDAAMKYSAAELAAGKVMRIGTITVSPDFVAGPFMSDFSSWGPTPDLKIKPEITAHGGEITSTVPGGYGEQSGTSMASPNMAGFMAIARQYVEKTFGESDPVKVNRLAMQLTMSTAGMVYDQDGLLYSPRKQGAGVAKLENVIGGTGAYLSTSNAECDYRPKLELGEDEERTGVYNMSFKVTNFSNKALTFDTHHAAMTETLADNKLTVSEQAYMFNNATTLWKVDGEEVKDGKITVAANTELEIEVTLTLDKTAIAYLEAADRQGNKYFANGMYVEGFMQLLSATEGQCDLSIPFLAFYGDWQSAPMLDYSAFEVAESAQDGSVLEEDKIKASVWETLPYNIYYNEKYVLPMGGYVYLLPDDADPMYVDEAYCSVSRYNEYYGEGNADNYMSSTAIKAVYAGLLRNARLVKYKMYNVETGELVLEDEINRVAKAYTGGGNGVPANVELELYPEEIGLVGNGKYRMDFEFFQEEPEDRATAVARPQDTYSFSFTVDYEAPVLEDVRVRYYNYKVDGEEKQRIYLDFDIYDNHYAMAALLSYPIIDEDGSYKLQLATDYPEPIRNAKENGTTTVSIEVTDIYEQYGGNLFLQIDDYAVNSCLYQIDIQSANTSVLPDGSQFGLAEGEDEITIDIYEERKVNLVFAESYTGNADPSNFIWRSQNRNIVQVKNGVLVGMKAGTANVTVTNGKGTGGTKTIKVTVTDKKSATMPTVPAISFGIMETYSKALVKAEGFVEVYSGKNIALGEIQKDPWYHPMTDLRLVWASTNTDVATVDQEGNVYTLRKGTATITARVERKNAAGDWLQTLYSASVTLQVLDEFDTENYMLTGYNGTGYNAYLCPNCKDAWVLDEMKKANPTDKDASLCPNCMVVCQPSTDILKIPDQLNVMYIYQEAFKENDNIKKIILPSTVIDIQERAFINCTALEEVYFVSLNHREDASGKIIHPEVDWADLSIVYEQAFYGCPNLKKVDLSNVKTITLDNLVFADCPSLEEVIDMPSIGTMYDRAFAYTALKNLDLSGLHMSGRNVFEGCNQIESIKTGRFTAIGQSMFEGCTSLKGTLVLETPKIGSRAFAGCVNLEGVRFTSNGGNFHFDIGDSAFEGCGSAVGKFTVDFGNENIRSIGSKAFANSALSSVDLSKIKGLKVLGGDIFDGTNITSLTIGDSIDLESLQMQGAAFKGCTVTVTGSKYTADNGVIYNKAKTKLLYANATAKGTSGTLTLPSTVTEIAPYALANNRGITKVVFNGNLEKVGEYAFANSALATVDFGGNTKLTEIATGTFQGTKLTTVTLPENITYLGDSAFEKSSISSFTANGLKEMGSRVFAGCKALSAIALADGIEVMGDRVFSDCTSLVQATLPSVKELGMHTFQGATSLKKVTFGENAETTGAYTFVSLVVNGYYYDYKGTSVEEIVFLGNKLEKIGEGAFYGCEKLKTITLPSSVTAIDAFAFAGTKALTQLNLGGVQNFGDYAFYNGGLTALALDNATKIGQFAFAAQGEKTTDKVVTAYTQVDMPIVKEIGNFAFLNSGLTAVELPVSLEKLGDGAFASSKDLKSVTVVDGNNKFFVEEGVLYRYINKDAGEYEICFYPATRLGAGEEGAREYAIKGGTLSVQAYAFYALNEKVLDKVLIPYSINTIGDSAFFESGISAFTFESVKAPRLEAVYRQDIALKIQQNETSTYYRGYYYTNFQTYVYNHSWFVNQESKLTMYYPSNGSGYDNHIYGLFFKTKQATGIVMDDNTRVAINGIEDMYAKLDTVRGWLNQSASAALKAEITTFSNGAKTTRGYYNNALNDQTQASFITQELQDKLAEVEEILREVKVKFNIPIVAKDLKISANSTHKSQYAVGQTFDKKGLIATLVYDDFSTEDIGADKLTLVTTTPMTKNTRQIELSYTDETTGKEISLRVAVTVTETGETGDNGGKKEGCSSVIAGGAAIVLAIAAGIVLAKKKEN